MTTTEVKELRVLFFQDGNRWVAQCIDYDICTSGSSIPEAQQHFGEAFVAELGLSYELKRQPLEGVPAAPEHYRRLFEETHERLEGQFPIEVPAGADIPPAHVIRAIAADRRINTFTH